MTKKTILARVERITPLTDSILQLILHPDHYVDYIAGQYLQILYANESMSYSIANAPLGAHQYELHVRHSRDNSYNQDLLADIKKRGLVELQVPLGECRIDKLDKNRPILFITGGTGFAPVKAMIEQLLANADSRPFELFWGVRSQSDLYMEDKVNYWQQHVSHFNFFSSISSPGKSALADLVLARHVNDLNDWQIVISGPFDMVYKNRDVLVKNGVSVKNIYSDAFSFEYKK